MAIKVVTGSTTMAIKVVTGSTTQVKKVQVGTPVRRVSSGTFTIGNIAGVDISSVSDGALLVYSSASENFEATTQLDNENTNFNGGNF